MKKYPLWLLLIFLFCSSAIINLNKNVTPQTVNKNISFVVYKSIDYTSSVYNNSYVQLQLTVEKVSENDRTLVWEKTFEVRLLRAYPIQDNAAIQTVTVPNINERNDHLEFTYTQTYNSNGYELQTRYRTIINQNTDSRLDISI